MTTRLNVTDPSGPVYNPSSLFSSNTVYHKGAWVLHMVRGAIRNDSLFFAGMREYRARHEYNTATTLDFLDAMSDVAGFDVTPYAYNYLYLTNRPNYRYSYGTGTVDGVLTTGVRLQQIQGNPVPPFTNKVDLRFGGAQTVTQTVDCNAKRQISFRWDTHHHQLPSIRTCGSSSPQHPLHFSQSFSMQLSKWAWKVWPTWIR